MSAASFTGQFVESHLRFNINNRWNLYVHMSTRLIQSCMYYSIIERKQLNT